MFGEKIGRLTCENCMKRDDCDRSKLIIGEEVCTEHITFERKVFTSGFKRQDEWEQFCNEWSQATEKIKRLCRRKEVARASLSTK